MTLPGHRSAGHATCSGRQARGRAPLTGGRGRRPRSTILCCLLREPGGPPRPQTCPHQMHWLPSELNKILCKPTTCKLKTKSSVVAVDRDTHPLESCRRAQSPELWRGVSDAGKSGLMWSDCPTSCRSFPNSLKKPREGIWRTHRVCTLCKMGREPPPRTELKGRADRNSQADGDCYLFSDTIKGSSLT